ncbi:MAG: MarR family transcriptional regulator [Rhodospirillaceae bacterium]|jgi:DNA-binding MarR family transcriptional regulator|nr:MarR family transcriptional regulator [Rhodospirillaceae bacterium]
MEIKTTQSVRRNTISSPELLNDGSDDQFRDFITQLFAVSSRLQTMRRSVGRAMSLNASQFSILLAVWHLQKGKGVGIQEIGKYLHIAPAHITAEVGQLVEKNLLDKKSDPRDNRAVCISTTDRSDELLDQHSEYLCAINDQLFAGMTREQFQIVFDFLNRFILQSDLALVLAERGENTADSE